MSETAHENVHFGDSEAGFAYDLDDYMDPTRMMQDSTDVDLGNFFARPLKIYEQDWGIGVTLNDTIDPWSLYFQNLRVVNRISNFNLLRCKLHVKLLVNGTPFHYGLAMLGYNPLDTEDEVSALTGLIQADLTQLSQRPHVYLNPTSSMGGEMELPFFWHKNYLSIPDSEWDQMGKLYLRTVNQLRHANGGTDPVTISMFAWCSEVSLAVPTSVEPSTLAPQAKTENVPKKGKAKMTGKKPPKTGLTTVPEHAQANTSGMISGPATALAKAAGALKMIPILTPYATAAEFAAEKTAAIAKLFGYSRPNVTADPTSYRPVNTSSLATTTTPDAAQKLTVDDQQGLSIDPRIAGVGAEDTLSIKSIASRESYLTTFAWSTADSPEALLWNMRVNPVLWGETGTGAATAYHLPACAFAAMPFRYWTGSMKVRFQVVKSAYHKGRLKLVYDPRFFASNEYNTNYLEIVDITDKDDFTIVVGNGQSQTLLEHLNPGEDGVTEGYSTTAYAADNVGNGVLGVYVVNKLTTPNTAASGDIFVNVYISMGDDFEVFVPEDKISNFTFSRALANQSEEEDVPAETPALISPLDSQEVALGPQLQYDTVIPKVWAGESIQSLRPLLRRYTHGITLGVGDPSASVIYGRIPSFPIFRGFCPGAIHVTAATPPEGYSYVNTHLLHWVTMAHQGWRGSIRQKWLKRGRTTNGDCTGYFQRALRNSSQPGYSQFITSAGSGMVNEKGIAEPSVKSNNFQGSDAQGSLIGWLGQVFLHFHINPSAEIEIPFYNENRFIPGKKIDYTTTSDVVEGLDYRVVGTTSVYGVFDVHYAAGEDFQAYFFTGLPRVYREAAPPV